MARPSYTPTEEERERVRRWIDENSGYGHNGVRRPDWKAQLYPKGITSFAREVNLTRATVSRALNGHSITQKAWTKIEAEVNLWNLDWLVSRIAKITGDSTSEIHRRLQRKAA